MAITAAMVKELRELTGAGMMDCKKALTETNGDKEKAIEFLREKGLAAIAKKELFDIKPLAYILKKLNVISINREKPDISTIKNILKAIKDGYVLGIFPEGTRIKEPGFGKAKAGLSLFAIKGKAQVVPISIISNYKLFNRVTIFIDKPISFEEYYKQKLTSEENERLSQNVLEVIKENYYIHSK